MGLDMYLKARIFIHAYEYGTAEEKVKFDTLLAGIGLTRADISASTPTAYISVNVAYWRKANAIHRWFVTEIQDDVDNCGDYYVEREQLTELRNLCKTVLESGAVPLDKENPLPPQAGFFFGSTEIDEGYFQDLRHTITQLNAILDNPKFAHFDFIYNSSW